MLINFITFFILLGMPIFLASFNKTPRAYMARLKTGVGDLPISQVDRSRKGIIIGYVKNLMFASLKHFLLHLIVFFSPILILPFLYREAQKISDEWYLSGLTRVFTTLIGFGFVIIPPAVFLRKSIRWIRIYYYLLAFLTNGVVAFIWYAAL